MSIGSSGVTAVNSAALEAAPLTLAVLVWVATTRCISGACCIDLLYGSRWYYINTTRISAMTGPCYLPN